MSERDRCEQELRVIADRRCPSLWEMLRIGLCTTGKAAR